jgi:hypothetical protein
MRSFTTWLIVLAALQLTAPPALAAGTASIAHETTRTQQVGRRVINLWWLPTEYWEASARELGWSEERVDGVRRLARGYVILAVLDARAGNDGKIEHRKHADLVQRLSVRRNGERLDALRQLNPAFSEQMPELSYFLTASVGPLAEGVRLLFFPNVDGDGQPVLAGGRAGELAVRYRYDDAAEPLDVLWRAPLTAVAGAKSCPKGGERLEASWRFCPWHGVPTN